MTPTARNARDRRQTRAAEPFLPNPWVLLPRGLGALFWLAVLWMGVLILAAVFADLLPLRDPAASDFTELKARPGLDFWFGTDVLGRDILARTIYGARVSLTVGFLAPIIGMVIGLALGMVAGYYRGRIESLIVGTIDVILAFPNIVLAMGVLFFAGADPINLIAVMSVIAIPANTRIARASTLVYAQREFVTAALAQGASNPRVMWNELLPNVLMPQLAYILSFMAIVIMIEGSLAFLGVGIPPPQPTWGGMIASGFTDINTDPHIVFLPALVLFLTVLSLNMIGDRLNSKLTIRGSAL